MSVLLSLLLRLHLLPRDVGEITLENLALRQQLTVMKRQYPRARLRNGEQSKANRETMRLRTETRESSNRAR